MICDKTEYASNNYKMFVIQSNYNYDEKLINLKLIILRLQYLRTLL